MLPWYVGVFTRRRNVIGFETVKENLLQEDGRMVVERRFKRRYDMMKCKSYLINEGIAENKEIVVFGFKDIGTKMVNYILKGCESEDLCEKDKLLIFWSKIFRKKEIEKRKFKLTGWLFMTLVKKSTSSKSKA